MYFPPQTVQQRHKIEAQEQPMYYKKKAKKFEKRRKLRIILAHFKGNP